MMLFTRFLTLEEIFFISIICYKFDVSQKLNVEHFKSDNYIKMTVFLLQANEIIIIMIHLTLDNRLTVKIFQ